MDDLFNLSEFLMCVFVF